MSCTPVTFPRATIDAGALRNNLAVVRRIAPDSRVIAVIKANAYGHGLIEAARALADAEALGVARIEEALALRAAGIDKPVLLLEGVFSGEQLEAAARHDLQIVVHSAEQLDMLDQYHGSHRFDAWLKLNTGMNRLGFSLADFPAALARLRRCAATGRLRLMTHFASAEATDSPVTTQQLQRFAEAARSAQMECSLANSAGLIAWPQARQEWVRPGLMLYGISPLAQRTAAELGLRPAMTLSTRLIALQRVRSGEGVGYNGFWRAQRDSLAGIAAIGYGDGYPRGMRCGAPVLVNGHEAPVVGRVSMDMTAVDVTDIPDVTASDPVTLWGPDLPVERVAPYADTISYELVCRVTARVARQWQ